MREVILYLITCLGIFLIARYSLFNLRFILLSLTRGDSISREDRSQAILASVFSLSLIVLITISFGKDLIFLKGVSLILFFIAGLLLATESDLHLQERSPLKYEIREKSRIRNEFFFWSGLLALIFILALFALV